MQAMRQKRGIALPAKKLYSFVLVLILFVLLAVIATNNLRYQRISQYGDDAKTVEDVSVPSQPDTSPDVKIEMPETEVLETQDSSQSQPLSPPTQGSAETSPQPAAKGKPEGKQGPTKKSKHRKSFLCAFDLCL